ncbi:MAG TPA: DUF4292 domain-containing protein [Myxococcota bacterium]|nr:DUF4292 domain-containing protein [Myxococcota bacterium]
MSAIRRAGAPLALLALLAAAGCPRPHPRPVEVFKSPDALVAAASAAAGKVVTLVGDMKVDSFDRKGGVKGKVKADASFILRRPDELRIDVFDLGGVPLVSAVTSPGGFALYDMGAKTYYYGPPSPCSMEVLLALPFGPAELVQVMLGAPPLLEGGTHSLRYNGKTGEYELKIARGEEKQECFFEATGPRLRACTLTRGDKVVSRLSYESWEEVEGLPGVRLPRRLYYEQPVESSDVLIKIKKVWVDKDLDPETFVLAAPTGVATVPVCAPEPPPETFVPGG